MTSTPRESTRRSARALATAAVRAATYGVRLDAAALANRLYTYHTRPCSMAARRALARGRVASWLGLGPHSHTAPLALRWIAIEPTRADPSWRRFVAVDGRLATTAPTLARVTHKLYVAPWLDHLPAVLDAAIGAFTAHGAIAFKVGATTTDLLRPDNLVAYFDDRAGMAGAAVTLQRMLADVPAHGVPFAAPIDRAGLLSWALDPPSCGPAAADGVPQPPSWRAWVTARLGEHLAVAVADRSDRTPWHTALARLRDADDVDPYTWEPPGAWSRSVP